ncbi:MAG: hypothetical protein B0D92_06545 [Spirochaeta sp. LUC14_002_19_P3]|nr:MAG: hypothetical protein B0D92_06545 [Spirochaeta sp. LUC14_002_19_P3]
MKSDKLREHFDNLRAAEKFESRTKWGFLEVLFTWLGLCILLVSCASGTAKQSPLAEQQPQSPQAPEEQTAPEAPAPSPEQIAQTSKNALPVQTDMSNGAEKLGENGRYAIDMDGQGWVFRSDLSTPGDWQFINRERIGEDTRFNYRFEEPGSWTFYYDRQSLSDGSADRRSKTIELGENGFIQVVDAVLRDGFTDAVNGQSGLEGMASEDKQPAMRDAVAEKSSQAILALLPDYMKNNPSPELLEAAFAVLDGEEGAESGSISILETLLRLDSAAGDLWLYRLASLLEKPGGSRDLPRALKLYQQLTEDWPFSKWRESAEERITWLKRHYFLIR